MNEYFIMIFNKSCYISPTTIRSQRNRIDTILTPFPIRIFTLSALRKAFRRTKRGFSSSWLYSKPMVTSRHSSLPGTVAMDSWMRKIAFLEQTTFPKIHSISWRSITGLSLPRTTLGRHKNAGFWARRQLKHSTTFKREETFIFPIRKVRTVMAFAQREWRAYPMQRSHQSIIHHNCQTKKDSTDRELANASRGMQPTRHSVIPGDLQLQGNGIT